MPGYNKQLEDNEHNSVYPVTKAECTYMKGGTVSVETTINDMMETGSKTEFLDDGKIKKTLASGNVVTTEFLVDSSIKETTTDSEGNVLYTKTTSFGDDESITVTIKYAGEEDEQEEQ